MPFLTCLVLLSALLLLGCDDFRDGPGEAKRFNSYRVFFAGHQLSGLPLETTERRGPDDDRRSVTWTFYYGNCDSGGGGFDEGGCMPPLQIQNYSVCNRFPGKLPGRTSTFSFRGAKASWRRGRGFEIVTGRTTVVIFGTNAGYVKKAAHQLHDIRAKNRAALLPQPAPGSVAGGLPCQQPG